MFRILAYSRKGLFFFKRVRIGLRLLRSSFKAVIFDHKKYFIFCFLLATIQLIRIIVTNIIDPTLSRSIITTEFLVGQNFFETLIAYISFPLDLCKTKILIYKILLFFIELVLTLFILVSLIYYVSSQINNTKITIQKSFKLSLEKYNLIIKWAILEILIMFCCALLGFMGEFIQFFWQLATSMSLQIIAFEKHNILGILKDNFFYFKKLFGKFLGIDLFTDFIVVTLTAFFYHIYKTQLVPSFSFLANENINISYLFIVFYLISIITLSETITFTYLYKIYHLHPKKLIK